MERNLKKGFNERASAIRIRTLSLSIVLIITIFFYFIMKTYKKEIVDIIDLIFISVIGVIVHLIYFPDGDLFGQKNKTFINNKLNYNVKATVINDELKQNDLDEYCDYEFEKRKVRFLRQQYGSIGITENEFEELRQLSPKELLKMEKYDFKNDKGEIIKTVFFTPKKRKRLYSLLYCDLPLERNVSDEILSACECDFIKKIKDHSKTYQVKVYLTKILTAVASGLFLSYIGYTFQDGITFEKIVKLIMCLCSFFATAVLSFSSGEIKSKVYKNKYYVELSNFLDGFCEWLFVEKKDDIRPKITEIKENIIKESEKNTNENKGS